jgi:cysteine desulfurase/selenocysteine lyase
MSTLEAIRHVAVEFPVLSREFDGRPITYLDSAATSQTPQPVIDAMTRYYTESRASIHRGVYPLAVEATDLFEGARQRIADWLGSTTQETIFTANATAALNLVAYTWGRQNVAAGDLVVLTEMEHHSNIVPWQLLCERTGATLRWFGVTDDGQLDLSQAGQLINERTRLVALAHQSNVLGTINPVREVADAAHAAGALVLVDAAQSVPHMPVDVQELGADFLGFTSHKMCGPTGIGVLWGRRELLEEMPPFLGGGEMIESVWMDHSTFAPPPHKFEAGTMPIAEAAGLDAAIDYLTDVGLDAIRAHEQDLIGYALDALGTVPGLRVLGPSDPATRGAAISFTLEDVHPHDVSQVLDEHGVAVRAGHHCAWPLHRRYGIQASTRASFYLYNTTAEVDALVQAIRQAQHFFGGA